MLAWLLLVVSPAWLTAQAPPTTTLPVVLRGAALNAEAPERSLAVITCADAPDAPTAFVRAGEQACGTLEIVSVLADGVTLRNLQTGRIERLPLRASVTDMPHSRVDVPVARATIDKYLMDMPAFLSSALAVPHFRDGKVDGYQIGRITPDGPIAALGLRDGDVIESVNGKPVADLAAVLKLAADLPTLAEVTMTIARAGRPMTFVFTTK